MKYQKGTFLIIPNKGAIKGLPPITQAVYLRICSYADDDGACYPSLSTLSECAGCTKKSVIKAIEQLVSIGLLARTSRYSHNEQITNMYQILVAEEEGGGSVPRTPPSVLDTPPSVPRTHRTIPINYNTILSTNVDNNSTGHSVPTEDITSQISTDQIISDDSPPPVPASPSPRRWTASMHEEIDKALVELEQYVDGLGLAYDPTEQKKYMHHILTARAYGELADKLRMTRLELAKNVALVSSKLKYLPGGVCAGPKAIYLRYRAVYNAAKTSRGVDTKPQGVYRL